MKQLMEYFETYSSQLEKKVKKKFNEKRMGDASKKCINALIKLKSCIEEIKKYLGMQRLYMFFS
jgi:hypothetical protein